MLLYGEMHHWLGKYAKVMWCFSNIIPLYCVSKLFIEKISSKAENVSRRMKKLPKCHNYSYWIGPLPVSRTAWRHCRWAATASGSRWRCTTGSSSRSGRAAPSPSSSTTSSTLESRATTGECKFSVLIRDRNSGLFLAMLRPIARWPWPPTNSQK